MAVPGSAPARARLLVQRAQELERATRWGEAAVAYEEALELDDTHAEWHYRLGHAHERRRRWATSAAAYAQWARRDPAATALDRHLLEAGPERFGARRDIALFLSVHLDEIRARARDTPKVVEDRSRAVYFYWGQGVADAPPVVRFCHRALVRHCGDAVVTLDDSLLDELVSLPEHVTQKIGSNRTKLSDVLRLELLSRYGGTWLDATCLTREDVNPRLADLRGSGFFAFTVRPGRLATWLMSSEPNHYVVAMLREAHDAYWRHFDTVIDYFIFHHMFEALLSLDETFRALWDKTPDVSARRPHRFARVMTEPYDAGRARSLLEDSFVHKLTFKYDPARVGEDSLLTHLLRAG